MNTLRNIFRCLRYDWPLHLVLTLTGWLPDNTMVLRLRGCLARPFLGRCGTDLRLGRTVTFYNPAQIYLGSKIYIAYGCWFMAGGRIEVGDEVMFGPYCVVVSSDHSRRNRSFRYGTHRLQPIKIGRGAWLGAHVTITAGSEVGAGSLVAAGSVVHGVLPQDVLAAGQPAIVKKRLPEESGP
jgi:acetyltransferase-like isoleucine patch superfamily enzyme